MHAESSSISTTSIYVLDFTSIFIVIFFAVSRALLIHRARSFDDVSGNPLVKVLLNSLPYLKVTTSVFSVKINLSCSDICLLHLFSG